LKQEKSEITVPNVEPELKNQIGSFAQVAVRNSKIKSQAQIKKELSRVPFSFYL
jgi:hypothetical protein